jgi:MFS family permease
MIYSVGPAIATIVAPTLGGLIAHRSSIRVIFFISAIAYSLSTFAFSRIAERPLRHHTGVNATYREALALPEARAVGLLKFAILGVLMLGVTLMPNYLEDVHNLSIETIGRFGSMNAIGAILLTLIFARVAFITSTRGIAIGTLAVGGLCAVVLLTGNPWVLAMAFMLRGGFLVTWSLFYAVFGDITPDRLRSRVFALGDCLGGIGIGLSPFLAGPLYGWKPAAPMVVCMVAAPFLAVAALIVERRHVRPAMRARSLELTATVPALLPAEAIA